MLMTRRTYKTKKWMKHDWVFNLILIKQVITD